MIRFATAMTTSSVCAKEPPRSQSRFTGKERDAESGLDYFGARYYSSNMGRFLSPDWSARPWAVPYADFTDPQSLNLYGYGHNNPLSKSDSDGHCDVCNWLAVKVGSYLGTHPDVANAIGPAVDKAVNSFGIKVFAGVGFKEEVGGVKLNANATFNAQTSVDGKKDGLSLQGTGGAKVGDIGAQGTVTAPLANGDGLVNPLTGMKVSGSLNGSSSLTDKVDGMDVAAKTGGSLSADTASAGLTVNGGVALVGVQVSSDISGWTDILGAMVNNAISDTKQFVNDLKESTTCTASGCAHWRPNEE